MTSKPRLMNLFRICASILLFLPFLESEPAKASVISDLTLVSRSWNHLPTDGNAVRSSISSDGSILVFDSSSSNLVQGDSNGVADVFIYEVATCKIKRINKVLSGSEPNGHSWYPKISGDGRYVTFSSYASNLVSGFSGPQAYRYDRVQDVVEPVSVATDGGPGNWASFPGSVTADGSLVAFSSSSSNLVADDTNRSDDVFIRNMVTGTTSRVSLTLAAAQANYSSFDPAISGDGRYVAFVTQATNMGVTDNNSNSRDVFRRDLRTGAMELVSVAPSGGTGNSDSDYPSISYDGRFVAFESGSSNLVAVDRNGRRFDMYIRDFSSHATRMPMPVFNDPNAASAEGVISADGRFLVASADHDPFSGSVDPFNGIYLADLLTGSISLISSGAVGTPPAGLSSRPTITYSGDRVAFDSYANNLTVDPNAGIDVFLSSASSSG